MESIVSASIRPQSGLRRLLAALEVALLALALGFSLIGVPAVPGPQLDPSWQTMLVHARGAGMQFGRDLIFTWGPWGFLSCAYNLGRASAGAILAWQVAGQFVVALAMVLLTRGLVLWRRLAFVLLFVGLHWLFLDVTYFVLIALLVVAALMRPGAPYALLIACAAALGFLSQMKFTYLVLASAGTLAAASCWAGRGSWGRAGAVAGSFAAAVLLAWVGAGQNPDNLYPYVMRSLEIASGYGDSMGLDEPWSVFLWGAGAALALGGFLACAWRSLPERAFAHTACAFLALTFYVMWKEGFTRADFVPMGGHVFGFFAYVIVMAPVLPGLLFAARRLHWMDAVAAACLAGIAQFDPGFYARAPTIVWQRFYWSVHSVRRVAELPQDWQRAFERACEQSALPAVRRAVGGSTIDVYNFNTALALLNGLNLDPRPIFQSYSAYTPSLEGWNLRFYQSERAPAFLLWSDERIDERYAAEDDAMLICSLAGHYAPVLKERGYWLLKRESPVPKGRPALDLVLERTVRLSEEVAVPEGRGRALWLRADARPTAIGRLRALAYKPALLSIVTTDERGEARAWRLVTRVARDGFMLAPAITTGDDAAAFFRGEARVWITSFRFEAPEGQEEFWSRVRVDLFAMPAIPLHPSP